MAHTRREIVAWVGSNVVPHEADLRLRLRRMRIPEQEIGDVIQDAYLRIAQLDSVAHIQSGRTSVVTAARTAFLQRIRRGPIDSRSELDARRRRRGRAAPRSPAERSRSSRP